MINHKVDVTFTHHVVVNDFIRKQPRNTAAIQIEHIFNIEINIYIGVHVHKSIIVHNVLTIKFPISSLNQI